MGVELAESLGAAALDAAGELSPSELFELDGDRPTFGAAGVGEIAADEESTGPH